MIYLSEDLIEIQHLGLGQYTGTTFRTMINPKKIQLIRTKGPNVHLEGENVGKKVYQIIYSYKGFTESFVIESYEYIQIIIYLATGKRGWDYYMTHPEDKRLGDFEFKALNELHGQPDDTPNAGELMAYIRGRLALIEKGKLI